MAAFAVTPRSHRSSLASVTNVTPIGISPREQGVTPRSDPSRLRRLLGLHAVPDPRIVDVTYGHGGFWRGLAYRPVRLDIRDLPGLDYVADWRALPSMFGPGSFDVVVWDPIHITDVGSKSIMGKRYAAAAAPVTGEDISSLYVPFLESARVVVQPETGVCIVKLADQVHNARQQLHFVDFVNTARQLGWTVCDYDMATRPSAIVDGKWIRELHVRKSWAFWIVIRNGSACEGPGRQRLAICPGCQLPFRPSRRDARVCTPKCRQRLHRGRV